MTRNGKNAFPLPRICCSLELLEDIFSLSISFVLLHRIQKGTQQRSRYLPILSWWSYSPNRRYPENYRWLVNGEESEDSENDIKNGRWKRLIVQDRTRSPHPLSLDRMRMQRFKWVEKAINEQQNIGYWKNSGRIQVLIREVWGINMFQADLTWKIGEKYFRVSENPSSNSQFWMLLSQVEIPRINPHWLSITKKWSQKR